jgi:hypothetical protein
LDHPKNSTAPAFQHYNIPTFHFVRLKQRLTNELLANGQIVREPVGSGPGFWAGAPGAFFAADERAWYLTYRLRRPRGIQPDRGGEARIARSADLQHWEDVWSMTKDQYHSASIEKSAICKGADGQWRYFTSFVDATDGRWCVAALKAREVGKFDATRACALFKAAPLGLEGIKDPCLLEWRGMFYMFLSVAVATPKTTSQSHSTLDIFNTGECVSATGVATSRDLDHWEWQGVVFAPGQNGWDRYCRRVNSVIPVKGKFLGFYDGSASHAENYEEKTGLAISAHLRDWKSRTPDGPAFTSPFALKSLRYIDAHVVGGEAVLFYEFARADGAHDLRVVKASAGVLPEPI